AGRITGGEASSTWAVAVMSGFQRKGRWRVPKRMNCLAFWGGGEIDLREADFTDREVVINCVAVMGGMNVVVPPGVEVTVRGIGVMGGFDHREEGVPGDPGAPRVTLTGFAFWGGVGVERKPTRAERQRLREERRRERLERREAREARKELRAASRDDVRDAH
ncbi:cell wall-active antibiotics response protein, partial [Streptomyces sp. TRM76130]|nr:cell wall-active antibiotics response protein [Streptomyces sp. TRM76130]